MNEARISPDIYVRKNKSEDPVMKPTTKPIISMDFDGVIHSYESGWQGARNIPDDPVPGALDFLIQAREHFNVHIFSSRSNQFLGRRAMKKWLVYHLIDWIKDHERKRSILERSHDLLMLIAHEMSIAGFSEFHDEDRILYAAEMIADSFEWPKHKPPALVSIDDRAINFTGIWPDPETLTSFKPWNKKGV